MNKKLYALLDAPIPEIDKDYLKDYIRGGAIIAPYTSTVSRNYYDEDLNSVIVEEGAVTFTLTGRIMYPDPETAPRVIYAEAYNTAYMQRVFIKIDMDCRHYGFNNMLMGMPTNSYEVSKGKGQEGELSVPEWISDIAEKAGEKIKDAAATVAAADTKGALKYVGIAVAVILLLKIVLS